MKRLIAILALLPLLGAGQLNQGKRHRTVAVVPPSYVQGCNNFINSASQSSITCTFGSNITPGNRLFVCVNSYSGSFSSVWSGDSDTYVADVTNVSWYGGGASLSCVYVASATGGSKVITDTATLQYPVMVGYEIHGGTYDKSDTPATGSSGTTLTSNNITPTANNSLVIGIGVSQSGPLTAGTNVAWTLPASADGSHGAMEYYSQPTAASINAQMTQTSQAWIMHIVDFHP